MILQKGSLKHKAWLLIFPILMVGYLYFIYNSIIEGRVKNIFLNGGLFCMTGWLILSHKNLSDRWNLNTYSKIMRILGIVFLTFYLSISIIGLYWGQL
jgi:hypothetical protein